MTTKWTKGPWRVEKDTTLVWGNCNPDDASSWGMGFPVARSVTRSFSVWAQRPDDDEAVANAHLTAAAPDLYAALDALLKFHEASADEPLHHQARDILAKARGEAQ
jgi:hypothetical protein